MRFSSNHKLLLHFLLHTFTLFLSTPLHIFIHRQVAQNKNNKIQKKTKYYRVQITAEFAKTVHCEIVTQYELILPFLHTQLGRSITKQLSH